MGGTSKSTIGRRCGVALLAMIMLATVGATSGLAASAPRRTVSSTALTSCQALLDGKYQDGSRLEAAASRSCATACGILADGRRILRDDPALVLAARQVCADACSFILEEGLKTRARTGPVQLAVQACWIVLTSGETDDAVLPVTDNSGRRWK